jgi:hypothetical protein
MRWSRGWARAWSSGQTQNSWRRWQQKRKEVVEAHTHTKKKWIDVNPKKKWRAAWKGQRWTYVYNTRLNQLFLFGRGNQGTTILNFKKKDQLLDFSGAGKNWIVQLARIRERWDSGGVTIKKPKKNFNNGRLRSNMCNKKRSDGSFHFKHNFFFSRIKFFSISNFKSVARYVTPLFLEGRENKKCSKEEKHTNKQNTDKNIWLALHRR